MIKVAFYDTKAYDKPSFEHLAAENDIEFKFLETKLNEDTAALADGCDAVCVFVNDTVNASVIEKLYNSGVKLIANIFWIIITGLPMAIVNAVFGCLWCITIIGIPFGKQFFKIARLALAPFGAQVV